MVLLNVQQTFIANFGLSRTGKTVTVSVLDTSGNVVGAGYSAGSVVELSDGQYGCAFTFTTAMTGYIKFSNTTDNLEVYVPFLAVADYRADITAIKKIELNRWKISSNQLTIYDDDGSTPLYVFNLKRLGVADGETPDERVPV
jgi:hypothetical protein